MIVVSTLVALWAISRPWPRWQIWLGLGLIAAGVLGLGLAVLVVPLIVVCVEAGRNSRIVAAVRRSKLLPGLVIMLFILAPWAIAAQVATDGEFLRVAIGRHVVERSMSSLEGHGGFPLFYPLTAVLVAMPWSLLTRPQPRVLSCRV